MDTSERIEKDSAAVLKALTELQGQYDSRLVAAHCLTMAARLYQSLRMVGVYTDEVIIDAFVDRMNLVFEDTEPPKVLTDGVLTSGKKH